MREDISNILILTGAGISAESGVATFRDSDGLWEKHDWREIATPEAFAENPQLVYDFYNARREGVRSVSPNPAHHAIARLEREWTRGPVRLITQNIDPLHGMAGSREMIAMHGELAKIRCDACGALTGFDQPLRLDQACEACGREGRMRPHVVWFGEMPLEMERIMDWLDEADLFAAIGTSGSVYPAAGFAAEASARGAWTVEINLNESDITPLFDEVVRGPAGEMTPLWVERLLAL